MYSYRYINQLYQFNQTNYTLILEDLENPDVPVVRIDKCFSKSPSEIDNEFLYNEAKKDILMVNRQQSEEPIIAEKNLTVEEQVEDS